jgi:RecB family exonuclease
MLTGPLAPSRGGEIFSATRIRVYRDCPAHYYFRYILGMPQSGPFRRGEEADELQDAEFPPDLRGRIFHSVMEQIDTLSLSALREEIGRLLAQEVSLQDPGRTNLVDEIHRLVMGVVGSSFWQEVQGGVGTRTEFTISAVLGEDFLSGTMDRVYRGAGGVWHVLDFKTDRVESGTISERAAEYWPQLEFYALLVHRFFGSGPVSVELLFTSMPDRVLRKDFSVEDLLEIEKGISSDIARIQSGDFSPRISTCPWCPFAPVCPWAPSFK